MAYPPIANLIFYGVPLAAYLGAVTLVSLLVTAAIGMLVLRGSKVPFTLHMNMARLTVVLAVVHVTVVYLTFF
jgi:hypothetical protein